MARRPFSETMRNLIEDFDDNTLSSAGKEVRRALRLGLFTEAEREKNRNNPAQFSANRGFQEAPQGFQA